MPPPTASGGISQERFRRGSRTFAGLSGTIGSQNLPNMTSLAASGRLQNAVKYCTKVRKTGPADQRVELVGHVLAWNRTENHADLVYSLTEYDVISYLWSAFMFEKTIENATSDGFGSNLWRTV